MITVTPKQAVELLKLEVPHHQPVMFTGAPGIGKTSISKAFGLDFVGRILFQWPGMQEPTEIRGMPWFYQENGSMRADLVPFNDMRTILDAQEPLLVLCDDFGQATNATQSSWMPVFLDRRIGNYEIPDHVSFVVCTNRRQDRSNVSGILTAVKSRMTGGIYELTISIRDWCLWALREKMPRSLISFIRFTETKQDASGKPENRLLDENPPREIEGYYCPRTVAAVGYAMNRGIPKELQYASFAGKCGEAWASEFVSFLEIEADLPGVETIIAFPDKAVVPDVRSSQGVSVLFVLCGNLANAANEDNFGSIMTYAMRLPNEFRAMLVEDCVEGKPELLETSAYVKYLTSTRESQRAVGL